MTEFGEGHPCIGKNCIECETCIFDRELFPDRVTPNEELKNKTSNNMCNNSNTCNNCPNLSKHYEHCDIGHFDAACGLVSYEAFGVSRPRRIGYNLSPNQTIVSPNWCPLKSSNSQTTPPPPPSQVTHRPNPQQTGPQASQQKCLPAYTSYSDRREKMKELKRHVDWEDIEEGKIYVIPRILNQTRKIVRVITKTNLSCICHEISEYTGNEYQYNSTIYPSDLDAVFITEMREF